MKNSNLASKNRMMCYSNLKFVAMCRGGRNRTFIKGFGDLYSTIELRPYEIHLRNYTFILYVEQENKMIQIILFYYVKVYQESGACFSRRR